MNNIDNNSSRIFLTDDELPVTAKGGGGGGVFSKENAQILADCEANPGKWTPVDRKAYPKSLKALGLKVKQHQTGPKQFSFFVMKPVSQ